MTTTQPALSDMLTIRDYLRERRDDLQGQGHFVDALALSAEVTRLSNLIAKAEAEAES